ncbi:hypothetical protein FE257_006912 [Aspergillus nanangensis]|uniref:Transcription factor domain-containing protein n=1 Tax=Aspergillus nanangensis TaxID=2582783 RepID=A0AAD4CNY8_ASPNN|nr:hypothetical protein FE257_006912 [Aspergillus nanangensis]
MSPYRNVHQFRGTDLNPVPKLSAGGAMEKRSSATLIPAEDKATSLAQIVFRLRVNADVPLVPEYDQLRNQTEDRVRSSYIGESGYMHILSQVQPYERPHNQGPIQVNIHCTVYPLSPALLASYADVFRDHCSTLCPILDKEAMGAPEIADSLLLQQALALVGSIIQPSLLHEDAPTAYYERAKILLHGGYESNPLASLLAVMLFYWWSTCSPHVVNCNVREPSVADFPDPKDPVAEIFVQWVRLCSIVGRVGDHLRSTTARIPSTVTGLLDQLKEWVHSLMPHLRLLPFATAPTQRLERDIYLLHLPYLSTITLLHMKKSGAAHVPTATTPAILSASCVAQIFEGLLIRGSLRFLQGNAGWQIALAVLALLNARRVGGALQVAANAHICVLRVALKEISQRWDSAKMYDKGIERLVRAQDQQPCEEQTENTQDGEFYPADRNWSSNPTSRESQEAMEYFPGAKKDTSPIFEILLATSDLPSDVAIETVDSFRKQLCDNVDNQFDEINDGMLEYLASFGMASSEMVFPMD